MPDSIPVSLTIDEMDHAANIGKRRHIDDLFAKRKDNHGLKPGSSGWGYHIEGACGEKAYAKWANRYWSGNIGRLKDDDVGMWQVRTRSEHWHDLMLHPEDADDRPFVLLTGLAPNFLIRGWIWAKHGKRPEYWKDPAGERPAFFVRQSVLMTMKVHPRWSMLNEEHPRLRLVSGS